MLMKASTGAAVEVGLAIAGLGAGGGLLTASPTAAFVADAGAKTGSAKAGDGVDAKAGLTAAFAVGLGAADRA
jgi:hypothetical protein